MFEAEQCVQMCMLEGCALLLCVSECTCNDLGSKLMFTCTSGCFQVFISLSFVPSVTLDNPHPQKTREGDCG